MQIQCSDVYTLVFYQVLPSASEEKLQILPEMVGRITYSGAHNLELVVGILKKRNLFLQLLRVLHSK